MGFFISWLWIEKLGLYLPRKVLLTKMLGYRVSACLFEIVLGETEPDYWIVLLCIVMNGSLIAYLVPFGVFSVMIVAESSSFLSGTIGSIFFPCSTI